MRPDPAYEAEILEWRRRRLDRLTAPDGWLSLIDLVWLPAGAHRAGSAPASAVRLPERLPAEIGVFTVSAAALGFEGPDGAVEIPRGFPDERTVARIAGVTLTAIDRSGRIGVRVRDEQSGARRAFRGIESFPIDPAWRLDAEFETRRPTATVRIPSVLGDETEEISPGALVFRRNSGVHRLDAILERGETDYWIVFGDATNGRETYGGGRFVYAAPPVDGRTVIDFNKSYNPPCVFSRFTTCPLPSKENRLSIRVEAGEKNFGF